MFTNYPPSTSLSSLNNCQPINGVTSLENCPSNLFQLLDLKGIRWKRYSSDTPCPTHVRDFVATHPSDDQILKLYAKCIDKGILACWRRKPIDSDENVPKSTSKLFARVNRSKEIWIFWWQHEESLYKEITSQFSSLEACKCTEKEHDDFNHAPNAPCGNWDDKEVQLGYEIRCLIFKAIHNNLENRLTKEAGYVRIGRWFIKPKNRNQKSPSQTQNQNQNRNPKPSDYLINDLNSDSWNHRVSLAFNFFIHGDQSTHIICSVETCMHDELVNVSSELISALSIGTHSGNTIEKLKKCNVHFPLQVVLAPYGFRGSLTGEHSSKYDSASITLINEWNMFYDVGDSEFEEEGIPTVMEVMVGGTRMKYPTHLILVEKSLGVGLENKL